MSLAAYWEAEVSSWLAQKQWSNTGSLSRRHRSAGMSSYEPGHDRNRGEWEVTTHPESVSED